MKNPADFEAFRQATAGRTLAELRCDVPPADDLLNLMDRFGLERWEQFVSRLESERS
jgi:hypothetical protein